MLRGHSTRLRDVAFADGVLVTASEDCTARSVPPDNCREDADGVPVRMLRCVGNTYCEGSRQCEMPPALSTGTSECVRVAMYPYWQNLAHCAGSRRLESGLG